MPPEWSSLLSGPVVLVAAHPDDEVIGAGGMLPNLASPTLVHVTDGAPRNEVDAQAAGFTRRKQYAAARRGEVLQALKLAGIGPDQALELGFVDQEASLHLGEVAAELAALFAELRPAAVLTHPYEGGHPDHDATTFAVHAACRAMDGGPRILEFTSYHLREGQMGTCEFLPNGGDVLEVRLTPKARRLKKQMFDCFATQQHMLVNFPIEVERFRPAPAYDFTSPPHAGKLFYEDFEWGMTGERFRALARAALEQGGIGKSL